MGNTITTNGVTTTSTDKDIDGNVKFNTGAITLPYVTQGQWSTPSNYSFLDTRYDSKYAPISGGGYLDKTSFDGVLSASAPYNTLKTGLDGLGTKYNNMQGTYNSNFSTIASNLGLTTSGGVVSGTINSSTFVTQAILDQYNAQVGPQTFDENTLNASKNGKSIRIYGNILFRSGVTSRTITFSNFSIMNQFSIKSIDSVIVQPLDTCDTGNGGQITSDGPDYICKQPVYSVKGNSPTGFTVVRPSSLSFPNNGAFWRYIHFFATGSLN